MDNRPFNLLTDNLPEYVLIAGKKEHIFTATAIAIDCLAVLQDTALDDSIKQEYLMSRIYPGNIPHSKEAMEEAIKFLKGAPCPEYEKANLPHSGEQSIYWSLDASAICASFRQAYGLRLEEIKAMHWWEFLALLYNIPSDTRMGSLFATRSRVVDPKLKPEQQRVEKEIKRSARPKDTRPKKEKQKSAIKTLVSGLT